MKKKKVAHVITRMIIGGAQENTFYTVQGLDRDSGFDVTLISGPTYGPEGALISEETPINFPFFEISFLRRNLNPIYDFLAFFQLFFHFLFHRYDIVHTHSAKAGILGRWAAKLAGVKIIIHTVHGLAFHAYEHPLKNKLYIFFEKTTAKITDKIITVCDDMIRQCLEAGIDQEEKFTTIYSGLDLESFKPSFKDRVLKLKDELKIPEHAFIVGKIGRLFHLKGHQFLIEAAREVIDMAPKTHFLIVGGGILEEELKKQVSELGLDENVTFTGLISTDNVPIFLKAMDMVVHVSLREGLPRVIPQAFISERPVVAFDIDGARDIIKDSENGYLVEPKNVSVLADRILKLEKNPKLRNEFCDAGKRVALKLFSKEKMVDDIIELYNQLLQEKRT